MFNGELRREHQVYEKRSSKQEREIISQWNEGNQELLTFHLEEKVAKLAQKIPCIRLHPGSHKSHGLQQFARRVRRGLRWTLTSGRSRAWVELSCMMDKNTCGCKWQSPEGRRRDARAFQRENACRFDDLMITIGAHKRVNLNKTVMFQEMTKRRMVPPLGGGPLHRWWRTEGVPPGWARKWGGSCYFELSYLLFASRFLLSPHFLFLHIYQMGYLSLLTSAYSSPSIRTYNKQGFEMKRKKKKT